MPKSRFIPLEVVGSQDSSPALTDVIVALYSQVLIHDLQETEDVELISYDSLWAISEEVFTLGCSIGLSNYGDITRILEQTHSDVSDILAECSVPLEKEVERAKESHATVSARFFLEVLFEPIVANEPVESDLSHQILSISFEYGCILAMSQRPAAIIVRNAFNRESVNSVSEKNINSIRDKPLEEFGEELFSAYKVDFEWKNN